MNNNYILNIESLKKSFVRNIQNIRSENADERFNIIDDVDIMLEKGKITALIGGNGAGKTTLFNIISGFERADNGKVLFKPNGQETELLGEKSFQIARLGIGRMFQDNHIFPNMTILENMLIADKNDYGELPFISIIFNNKNKRIERARIEKAENIFCDLFGKGNPFWEMRFQKAKNLSYGQQRLLGLARLLMGDYKLLLLDEPTSGVNPSIIEKCMEIIRYFVSQKKLSIFLIEHNMKVVLEVADFCYFLSHGKKAAFGFADEVLNNSDVRKTYLGI